MEEVLRRLPPVLMDELVEEVFFRLPPDEPAWLARASAVCKPWRRILAAPRFRLRYRELHGTPPLLGFFMGDSSFVPTYAIRPAWVHTGWDHMFTMDCRHGRALFLTIPQMKCELVVLDPLTGHQRRVPSPNGLLPLASAAVLCAAQGCDHQGCQGAGHFLVVLVSTDQSQRVTSGRLYSSETGVWSELTSAHHPDIQGDSHLMPSVLVGDTLYFNAADGIFECRLGAVHRLSMLAKPVIDELGTVMATEDGALGFAAVVDVMNLTIWSMETAPEGAMMGWAKLRVIDLKTLLPDGALSIPKYGIRRSSVSSSTEGAQVLFMRTCVGSYMVNLESWRARKVSCDEKRIFPYMRFYIPAMEAAQGG